MEKRRVRIPALDNRYGNTVYEELEALPDHAHLLVSVDPQYGIHWLMKLIKGRSTRPSRQEFPELKRELSALWTNSYFILTAGNAPLSASSSTSSSRDMPDKTYQYRLYLTKKQETPLTRRLRLCCEIYNATLQECQDAYHMTGKSIGFAHRCAKLI